MAVCKRASSFPYCHVLMLVLFLALRQSSWEHPFIRLIHLLAHHPDFSGNEEDEDDLKDMVK